MIKIDYWNFPVRVADAHGPRVELVSFTARLSKKWHVVYSLWLESCWWAEGGNLREFIGIGPWRLGGRSWTHLRNVEVVMGPPPKPDNEVTERKPI